MSVHKNMFIKRVGYSLVFGLFLISLFAPVYAPNRRPDYIEWMPVVPVGDLEMEYHNIDLVQRSAIQPQQSGIIGILIGLFCDGTGIFTETVTGDASTFHFTQQMTLNFVFTDGSVHFGDIVGVSGRSNITIVSAERRISFNCVIYGNATYLGEGEIWLQLSLVGQSPIGPLLFLQIQGIFSQPVDPETILAEGLILSFGRFPGNF